MWWLGLFFERLSLDIVERGIAVPETALALCDRRFVLDATDAACAQGIAPGMKRAAAQALVPSLPLLERDPDAERRALESVAIWMQQFTPSVSLQSDLAFEGFDEAPSPCGLLAEVAPSLRYFGGFRALFARVHDGLRSLGYRVRIGAAPTASAAWLLARHRNASFASQAHLEQRIGALPAHLLARTRAQRELLDSIDVRSVRELLALPRAAIARRLGGALLDELDRALGRLPEPRRWYEAPSEFHLRLELLANVEHAEALVFAARRLIDPMTGWLVARHAAIRAFTLHVEHDEHDDTHLEIRLADPTRDPGRLLTLLREKLAVTRLPAAAHALRLRCEDVVALPDASGELFPAPGAAHENLRRLVERLQARLGAQHVQRLRLVADHRPEAAYRIEPIDAPGVAVHARRSASMPSTPMPSAPIPGAPMQDSPVPGASLPVASLPRPLWLLDRPIALAERNNRPWWHSPLRLLAGPERIEGGWWDDALMQRDYFIAEDDEHALYWIYRERCASDARRAWFVQGRFG
ncbi:MAG: DNA polymerase Y family protein [Burkholderiaceae bacterium]|nr:DNA polymerase Y family protein [Burkholderiaceae bacterium]